MTTIQDKVIEEISLFQGVPINQINLDTKLDEDGFDSLEKIELTMNIEDEFNIQIEDKDIESFTTVKDIVDYVTNLKEKQNDKSSSTTV